MSKTQHFIALMCVLSAALVACALAEAPTESETGWLVVQTLPTGALRCWEIQGSKDPCWNAGPYYPNLHLGGDVSVISSDVSCAPAPNGNWPAAYEALRVSPPDCGQSRPALAGAQ
jgi:hypothetical protein